MAIEKEKMSVNYIPVKHLFIHVLLFFLLTKFFLTFDIIYILVYNLNHKYIIINNYNHRYTLIHNFSRDVTTDHRIIFSASNAPDTSL